MSDTQSPFIDDDLAVTAFNVVNTLAVIEKALDDSQGGETMTLNFDPRDML